MRTKHGGDVQQNQIFIVNDFKSIIHHFKVLTIKKYQINMQLPVIPLKDPVYLTFLLKQRVQIYGLSVFSIYCHVYFIIRFKIIDQLKNFNFRLTGMPTINLIKTLCCSYQKQKRNITRAIK